MNTNNPIGENGNKSIHGRKAINVVRDESADDLLEKFFGEKGYELIQCNCAVPEIEKEEIKFDKALARRIRISKERFQADIMPIKTGTRTRNKTVDTER